MRTRAYKMCSDCAEIVMQGYTDSIDDTRKHQARCNYIDQKVLPPGYYWACQADYANDFDGAKCEGCGVIGIAATVFALGESK